MSTTAERLRRLSRAAKECRDTFDASREARDAAIVEADAEGWGLREIARTCEMSVSHTQRIVVNETARRQADNDELAGVD